MRIRNSLVALVFASAAVWAESEEPHNTFKVNLAQDSPLALVSADWGQSRTSARGGAMVVDLHSTLQFRNSSPRRIRGVAVLVLAQEVTPGGKASVTIPSLDVEPGDSFPIRLDLRLMRPLQSGTGALVEVSVDGVLFEDLGFYGPNKLNSRRAMTAWELEARRDRKYFLAKLESGGAEALQQELLASLKRSAEQPRLDLQLARAGRATAVDGDRDLQFAFVALPESPIELMKGSAQVSGSEARLPRIDVQNRSRKVVRHLDIGWLVQDSSGREFQAGAVPAEVNLAPGQRQEVSKDAALRFSRPGSPGLTIAGMVGFVQSVEFADGQVWVPSRAALAHPSLSRSLGPSPEEQRLAELYRRKGLEFVIQQLRSLR